MAYHFLAELAHGTTAVGTVDPGLSNHIRVDDETTVTTGLSDHSDQYRSLIRNILTYDYIVLLKNTSFYSMTKPQ